MFGARGRPQYPSRNVPTNPGYNHGHNNYPNSVPAYRNNQPLNEFDEEDDEWDDESDEEVYENEHLPNPARALPRIDHRQPPPPARPPHNPPSEQPAMRSMHSNYPHHRPINQPPPPIHPRDNDDDDMYLPIDGAPHSQGPGFGRGPPSLPSGASGFNNTVSQTAVAPHRPSYPPPSTGRPPMPTPTSHAPPLPNPMLHDPNSSGSDRSQRSIPASPRSSRNNRSSPRSSPGPPTRGGSDRSSGSRLPYRGGSGSSQDSVGSGERPDVVRPPFVPSEQRNGGFEVFKDRNVLPGFKSTQPPDMPHKGTMPQFSKPKPDKPAKPSSGFSQFERKPIPLPKPGKEKLTSTEKTNKEKPSKSKPIVNSINTALNHMLNNLPRSSEKVTSPGHGSTRPPVQLPQFSNRVEQQPWFKNVTRQEAQTLIERRPREGCFIVRPGRDPNPYSLSVFSGGIVNLIIRRRSDMNYALGNEKDNEKFFPTVVELIQYHMTTPLVLASGKGSVILCD